MDQAPKEMTGAEKSQHFELAKSRTYLDITKFRDHWFMPVT
jgi:hypothetical protein